MSRASRLWAFLRRHRRQLVAVVAVVSMFVAYLAMLLHVVNQAAQSDDPSAPAAIIAMFIAGLLFLKEYLMPAMNTILSTPWFLEVFPDKEASP